jgi:glycosyltransferase involved in cell wall biosynthesis
MLGCRLGLCANSEFKQVSEALAHGLPVVMSPFTKDSFDNGVPGCVGSDIESYKKCIEDLDGNVTKWEALRDEGISYIERTHSRQKAMKRWEES